MRKSIQDMISPTEATLLPQKVASSLLPDDDLKYQNIFFATPCYGGLLTDQFFLSMVRMIEVFRSNRISHTITTLRNESLITRGRNILTAMFLASECTHLMFIDADIEFNAEDIIRMIKLNQPIVAGAYPKKTLPIQYAINLKIIDPTTGAVNVQDGAVEVLDASTGFFLVKREVFLKMIQAYPELHLKNDNSIDPKLNQHCYALFDTMLDPVDNRYLSEDYTFCRRWQQLGGKIWLDPKIKLNHVGSYTFEGNPSLLFKGNIN